MSTSTKSPNHPSYYSASSTALLVCDYQNMIVAAIEDQATKAKVISSVKSLLDTARAQKLPIIHCLIDTTRGPITTSKLTEQWESRYKPALAAKPFLGHEYAELAPGEDADKEREFTVGRRPGRRSALSSEGIMELLKEKFKVTSLIVCGISSSGVVLSTARHASEEGFVMSVVEDACWDQDAGVHKVMMEKILQTTSWVLGLDEVVGIMEGSDMSRRRTSQVLL
ncbi:putative hydrolase protein [Mycena epipterygia]|nr:putative hydrolase protein [Mycena epipterygia]